MNTVELFRELNTFYQIRGDNYGRKYLSRFLDMILENDVSIRDWYSFFLQNKDSLRGGCGRSTEVAYQTVLKQFIRYVQMVYQINDLKNKRKHTISHKTLRIHDDFQTFKNKSNRKIIE